MALQGDTLKAIREAIGWSPAQLASVLAVPYSAVIAMESGVEPIIGSVEDAVQHLCPLSFVELAELARAHPVAE